MAFRPRPLSPTRGASRTNQRAAAQPMGCGGSKPEADWDKDFDSPGSPAKAQEQKGPRVGVCSFESQYITRFPKVPTDVPADCKELNIADNELLSALDGVGALPPSLID